MQPIYIDLHIHTSENANNLNTNYDIAELVGHIKKLNGDSPFMSSLTDHNTINKSAYLKAQNLGLNLIIGVELHIQNRAEAKSYHCHIYFNLGEITENIIDEINTILDELYPSKKIHSKREENGVIIPETKVDNIETIIRKFDNYDFLLLPHGGQNHRTFDKSVDGNFNSRLEKSLYYNQFDGFTSRSNEGVEETESYFKKLGISS